MRNRLSADAFALMFILPEKNRVNAPDIIEKSDKVKTLATHYLINYH